MTNEKLQPEYQDVLGEVTLSRRESSAGKVRGKIARTGMGRGTKATCTLSMKCFKVGTSCKKTTAVLMNVAHHIRTVCQGHNSIINRKVGLDTPMQGIPGRFSWSWH